MRRIRHRTAMLGVAFLSGCAVLCWATFVWACAACGNPSLPQLPTGTGSRDAGEFALSVSLQSTALQVSHPAGCEDVTNCDEVPIQPEHTHELLAVPIELNTSAQWSVNEVWGLELDLPVRVVHVQADYETPDGGDYEPVDEGVHHRTETLYGLGDARLRGRALMVLDRWWLIVRAGTSLPFGSTVQDPFAAGEIGERHQHIQFGNGTFDPLLGVSLTRGFTRWQFGFQANGRWSLYENRQGFRAGAQGNVGVNFAWKARPRLLPYAVVEGAFEGPERWNGVVQQDGLIGRQELRAGLGLRGTIGQTTLDFAVRAPIVRNLSSAGGEEPGELRNPVSVSLSAGWRL